jgi:hypothetical protein
MNTSLLAPQGASAPPDTQRLAEWAGRAPRRSLWDRVALRLALALLLWSTRPARTALPRSARTTAWRPNPRDADAAREARQAREAAWVRAAHLHNRIRL